MALQGKHDRDDREPEPVSCQRYYLHTLPADGRTAGSSRRYSSCEEQGQRRHRHHDRERNHESWQRHQHQPKATTSTPTGGHRTPTSCRKSKRQQTTTTNPRHTYYPSFSNLAHSKKLCTTPKNTTTNNCVRLAHRLPLAALALVVTIIADAVVGTIAAVSRILSSFWTAACVVDSRGNAKRRDTKRAARFKYIKAPRNEQHKTRRRSMRNLTTETRNRTYYALRSKNIAQTPPQSRQHKSHHAERSTRSRPVRPHTPSPSLPFVGRHLDRGTVRQSPRTHANPFKVSTALLPTERYQQDTYDSVAFLDVCLAIADCAPHSQATCSLCPSPVASLLFGPAWVKAEVMSHNRSSTNGFRQDKTLRSCVQFNALWGFASRLEPRAW